MARLSPRERIQSFRYAGRGVGVILGQHNAWIHVAATVAVLALAVWLELGLADCLWLILAVALVWTAEGLNTALEELADAVHPEQSPGIARAKDAAAGAVLLAAGAAALIGLVVLGPPLLAWLVP